MIPASFPLTLYRGDSSRWQFVLWEDEGKTMPVDLSDVTPKAEIRDKPGSIKTLIAIECVVELPNKINATLSADDAKDLPTKGQWDLQLTYATTGDVATVLAGPVTTTPDITDSTP